MFYIVLFLQHIQHNGPYDKIAFWLTEYGRARRENIWLLLRSICTFARMLGPYVLTIFSRPALPVSQ